MKGFEYQYILPSPLNMTYQQGGIYMIILLFGIVFILIGTIFLYFENKSEGRTMKVINILLELNPFNPGAGCMVIIGILLLIAAVVTFISK